MGVGSWQRRDRPGSPPAPHPLLSPLRHQEKPESAEEEMAAGRPPRSPPRGPCSSVDPATCRLCFLKKATYPLCASDSYSEGSPELMPVEGGIRSSKRGGGERQGEGHADIQQRPLTGPCHPHMQAPEGMELGQEKGLPGAPKEAAERGPRW